MESHLGILYTYLSGINACWGSACSVPAAPAQVGRALGAGSLLCPKAALWVRAALLGCLQAAVIPCIPMCHEGGSNSQEITGFTLLKGKSK